MSIGMPLNYKILVQDLEIKHILHNSGKTIDEVPFIETKMKAGDKVEVEGHSLGEMSLLGEIVDFPIAMLVCQKQ